MQTENEKTEQLLEAVARRRGLVLNIVESEVGRTEAWFRVRPRLLGAFGENGLARDVKRIMGAMSQGESAGSNE